MKKLHKIYHQYYLKGDWQLWVTSHSMQTPSIHPKYRYVDTYTPLPPTPRDRGVHIHTHSPNTHCHDT